MQRPHYDTYQTQVGRVHGIEASLDQISPWNPTPEAVREAALRGHITAMHIGAEGLPRELAYRIVPTQDDVEKFADRGDSAIRAGRLIDFGHWTNDVIKHGGNRGGPMYTKGVLAHPFRDDYLFMHSWDEGDSNRAVAVYLVTPLDPDNPAGDCEVVELAPMKIEGEQVLVLGDRLMLEPARNVGVVDYRKYHCSCIPAIWRYHPVALNGGMPPENAAAGNVLDPLMTALLILATRGIDRVTVSASEKLQRARAKNKKPPIPPYERVHSAPYITAITNKIAHRPKLAGLGGTHASPIPHLRMGHTRTYPNGKVSLVRDALVNFTDEARQSWMQGARSHYVVKP